METNAAVDLRKAYRTTVFIGLAMLASLIIYAVVVELIKKQNAPFGGFSPLPADVVGTLRYVLLAVAAVEFIVIQILNKLMLSAKAPAVRTVAVAAPFGQLVSAAVVTFALCESVAIYGLVLFLIQGDTSDFYLFLMISLVYYAVYFPKYGKWEEWMQERQKARRQ